MWQAHLRALRTRAAATREPAHWPVSSTPCSRQLSHHPQGKGGGACEHLLRARDHNPRPSQSAHSVISLTVGQSFIQAWRRNSKSGKQEDSEPVLCPQQPMFKTADCATGQPHGARVADPCVYRCSVDPVRTPPLPGCPCQRAALLQYGPHSLRPPDAAGTPRTVIQERLQGLEPGSRP